MSVDIRPGLRARLLANAAISSMVGGSRIFPVKNKEGNRDDSIIYIRILENAPYHFRGSTQLIGARFQLDSLSQSTDRAYSLAELVKEQLGGASGAWFYGGSSPSDYVTVQGAFHLTGFEDFNEEAALYRFSRDYMIWYEDSQ